MNFHKTAIKTLRKEIQSDLNVNYIIDYLVQNRVLTANDRDAITAEGRAVGDITNPMQRETVIERETETFLDLMLEKENMSAVFYMFVNVLYKDDNYPWLAKRLQQLEDKLKSGGDDVMLENKLFSSLSASPSPSPVKKRSSNFDHFKDVFMDEHTSDITLIVGQKRFPAHKFMLYSRSDVFKKMFFDRKGCDEKEIVLYDTEEESFETMLRYCYGVDCDFHNCVYKSMDLYKLSHKFQINCLMNECLHSIISLIDCNNLVIICDFALIYGINELMAEIKTFVANNSEIIHSSQLILTCDGTAMEVLATILSFMSLPQRCIIDTIGCLCERNCGTDLSPLKHAVNLDLCETTDIDSLKDLRLFTISELFDIMRLKCLRLEESSGSFKRKNM